MPRLITFATPGEMREWSGTTRRSGQTIALVPTMGALHDGHLALIATARSRADVVVVSIFVNPLQFNERGDFDGYPRPIDDDVASCAASGADVVYAPTAAEMYPSGHQTRVVPGPLAETMEGEARPGHFEGVTTVVTKLFSTIRPHIAVFGQKDYQQLAIVRQMAADLDLGVEVVGAPTVRESDGVALSSRNRRLTPRQRAAAVCVPGALAAAAALAADPSATVSDVIATAAALIDAEPLAALEYVSVFDARTLIALDRFTACSRTAGATRIATAVRFGDVRLIDNRDLFGG